jgi:hypothetical protein
MNDAEASATLVACLAAFSASLAKFGLATYGVALQLLHFGSWTVEVGTRHKRLLVQWGGKESLLSVSRCVVADSQAARDWELVTEEEIVQPSTDAEIFRAAENLVLESLKD